MYVKETKKVSIGFEKSDAILIHRLVKEQVGQRTIGDILDEMSYVFDWYKALMTLLGKINSTFILGWQVNLTPDEINVLTSLLSKAYNSETEKEKDAIKAIADVIDQIRN